MSGAWRSIRMVTPSQVAVVMALSASGMQAPATKNILTGHTDVVKAVSFSPDGKTLASGSAAATIHLWDVHTGECKKTLTGYTSWVNSIAFSPDG